MPIDYKRYPANWMEIRSRILKRAGNCCEICGVENYSNVKCFRKLERQIKIVLTIAHLDHDEDNHEVKDDRLMALCQACHIKYDSKEKVRRKRIKKRNAEKIMEIEWK